LPTQAELQAAATISGAPGALSLCSDADMSNHLEVCPSNVILNQNNIYPWIVAGEHQTGYGRWNGAEMNQGINAWNQPTVFCNYIWYIWVLAARKDYGVNQGETYWWEGGEFVGSLCGEAQVKDPTGGRMFYSVRCVR
jgi:hypothetical protein